MKLEDLELFTVPPSVRNVIAKLDQAPAGEVYSIEEMVETFRCSPNTLQRAFRRFPAYRIVWSGNRTFWGNPEAIIAAQKRKEAK